ncbi:RNA polymerase sigma-70 factor [Parabacteroides timonensis]|uniref:RNA polymerase sigma-70 factor n=1 Tax=Parabacteroides timonensis TaxID=1871013 RepID=UPI00094F09D3|nr:RNA polymerase sigma-70 factor [Parabacteroides timonensis]
MINTSKEDEYVKALSNGDSKAFELLFLRYQPKLVYFFAGFVHDDEIAQDLAQDLFFNLWNNRSKLSGIRSFQSYLYQMARNILYNYYDHSLVQKKYGTTQFLSPSVSDDLEEQLFASELQALVNIKVEQMPPQRKLIFRMSRIEGLSNEEIASRLNINKRTVENHLTTALADLRKMLKVALLLFFH